MYPLPYDLIVFDLETNQPTDTIIEIGAVRFRRNFTIADSFNEFTHISEALSPHVQQLTGITPTVLQTAETWPTVAHQFREWAQSFTTNIVLASWSPYDVVQLKRQWPGPYPFRQQMLDIKSFVIVFTHLFGPKKPPKKSSGLTTYLTHWDVQTEHPAHRALPDAINTARLLQRCASYASTTGTTMRDFFGIKPRLA